MIHFFFEKTVTSTQDFAFGKKELIQNEDLFVFSAFEQTEGRGRYGRLWESTPGENIMATFAFNLREDIPIPLIPLLLAYSVLQCLPASISIKWPNDLYIGCQKLGGILTERKENLLFIGLGLNVNSEKVPKGGISLKLSFKKQWEMEPLLQKIAHYFEQELHTFDPKTFIEKVTPFLLLTGKEVTLSDFDSTYTGHVLGLDEQGGLQISLNGVLKTFYSATILDWH